METAKKILKKYYGYDEFRDGQELLVNTILNKKDVLGIMPTGAGKSICYQIPALLLGGTSIVISPLISLMKDQVDTLNQIGIHSTYINSSLTSSQYMKIINTAKTGAYTLIYVAPERLDTQAFKDLIHILDIPMVAIDEAHCVSQWGHDFRKSYKEIANMIKCFKKRPVVAAFTATATEIVKNDIINLLDLNDPYLVTTGFDRKNLYFNVEKIPEKKKYIFNYLNTHKNKSGIIYCATRKNVDMLYKNLQDLGYDVAKYHAGLGEKEKRNNQEDFIYDKKEIMIATNAFGMGIDKSNIRFIIHYNMPKAMENYYQEAGRSGRDGEKAECILLFSRADIITNKLLIELGTHTDKSNEYQKLNEMVDYCNTEKCLRQYILEYFGEKTTFTSCNNCSNCNNEKELVDITIDAKKILSCIKRMDERYGSGLVADVLKGSNTMKIKQFGLDKLSTHGIMNNYSKNSIRDIISYLIAEGYITQLGDKFPILKLSSNSSEVLFNNKKVWIKKDKIKEEKVLVEDINIDTQLLENLKLLRKQIASENNIPPFIVFSDTSLIEMSKKYPQTKSEMLNIIGVGNFKFDKYGESFIAIIREYIKSNDIEVKLNNTEKQTSSLKEKVKKTNTNLITYNLLKEGKSISEIENIRKLSKTTIESHILNCINNGLDININTYIQTIYKEQILEAIKKFGPEKLKPIKDSLPKEVKYIDIKYYLYDFKTSKL